MSNLVVIESPFSGQVFRNVEYARRAIKDSLGRGENPIASHLLYTQPGILDDDRPDERKRGIESGLAWHQKADTIVFYIDYGFSGGMMYARQEAERMKKKIVIRMIGENPFWTPCKKIEAKFNLTLILAIAVWFAVGFVLGIRVGVSAWI